MRDTTQNDEHATAQAAARGKWITPVVSRIAAGSAEDGARPSPDSGQAPS